MPAATSQAGVPRQSFFAADARADGLQRKVTIEGGQVRIARRYKGMAMQIGVLPTTGIPLPLISYGGSSAMMFLSATGLILNVDARRFGSDD